MERRNRISSLWNWLPAFRAVAELENLALASKRLGVSASALSRTVRLLEDELGEALFDRLGRRLVLNHRGALLLAAVREAMRRVDDALDAVTAGTLTGPIRIAAPGSFVPVFVLPALQLIKKRHPDLRPVLESVPPTLIPDRLRTGDLDLALTDQTVDPGDDLVASLLLDVEYGVYCAPGHPLYDRAGEPIELADLRAYEFVAPPGAADHWPAHLTRTIGIQTNVMSTGVELCRSGEFLAVLPDVVARGPHVHARPLRRLGFHVCPPVPLYAVSRQSYTGSSPTLAVLTAIRDALPV